MILQIYTLLDSKAAVYGTPFFMLNDQMALRAFSSLVNDPSTLTSKFPADFNLYAVGSFDDNLCEFKYHEPKSLGNATQFAAMTRSDVEELRRVAS